MSRRLSNYSLLDAVTTGSGTLNQADMANVTELGVYVLFGASVSAGVLVIETAPTDDYAGTWAVLATINWSAASKCHYTAVTGAMGAVRVRITTTVVGGTVTVKAVANQV
jgi:hypothetical protein